jgi:hypothetical protein
MSVVKRHLAEHEERFALVEEVCIDKGALVLDTATEEVYFSADEDAFRNAYVAVFQAWARRARSRARLSRHFDAHKICPGGLGCRSQPVQLRLS